MDKYNVRFVMSLVRSQSEISFLKITSFSDGTVVKVEVETYETSTSQMSSFQAVFRDEKKRQKKTYEKAGVTKEEVAAGLPAGEFEKAISDWFTEHPGLVVGYDLEKHMPGMIQNEFLDTHKMALYCKDVCHGADSVKEDFADLVKVYKKLERLERNKIQFVLKSAYYWECIRRWERHGYIFFNTSVGTLYYDIAKEKWDMTQKERSRTGLVVECFDIDEVKDQAFRKYRVVDLKELEMRLRADIKPCKISCA